MANQQDYVYEMYSRLCKAAEPYTKWSMVDMAQIAYRRHCGDGYFSWDGMLDDLAALTGDEDIASAILNKC